MPHFEDIQIDNNGNFPKHICDKFLNHPLRHEQNAMNALWMLTTPTDTGDLLAHAQRMYLRSIVNANHQRIKENEASRSAR